MAVDLGIRFFDTADAYGSGFSESILGDALHGSSSDVVVTTKVGYHFQERPRLLQLPRLRLRPAARPQAR